MPGDCSTISTWQGFDIKDPENKASTRWLKHVSRLVTLDAIHRISQMPLLDILVAVNINAPRGEASGRVLPKTSR